MAIASGTITAIIGGAITAIRDNRVAAGEDANVALLVRQRGAPSNAARDIWITARVEHWNAQGKKSAESYRIVATELAQWPEERITAKTVKNIYFRWRGVLPGEAKKINAKSMAVIEAMRQLTKRLAR